MDVKMMDKLKDKLCEELEQISRKPGMSGNDLDQIHKLTDTIKNLDKIEMIQGEGGHSQRGGMWNAEGSYARNNSYGYDDDMSMSRRRYSRDDGRQYLMDEMSRMANDESISYDTRNSLRRAMDSLRNN